MTRTTSPIADVSILQRIKEAYLIWVRIVPHISKTARFTIANRIENKLLDLLELSYATYFSEKTRKAEKIEECILVLDSTKFILSVAWQGKLISNKQYEEISVKFEEVGKMLGGWKRNMQGLQKKNPA